jgi:predicted amidohydrolase
MVAIAQPPISSSEISDARIRYRDDKTREITSEWSVLAIKTAAAKGAKLIIFPELFMPDGALDTVRENAKKVGIGVVCGVEGVWVDSKYSNFANIVIPDVPYDHKQFKKFPSNYEPQNFQTKGGQLCFLQSSIGSFSVVLCSDPPLLVVQLAV